MSPRQAIERMVDALIGSPFDRTLARAASNPRAEFLFIWNRGLGDIALGIEALFRRIRDVVPGARIVVVTRDDLREGFVLAGADDIHVMPGLERGPPIPHHCIAAVTGIDPARFTAIFEEFDPERWVRTLRDRYPPRLAWPPEFDARAEPFLDGDDARPWIGVHAASETATHYSFNKDWPFEHWQRLFALVDARLPVRWVLFGHRAAPPLPGANVLDLRGRTSILDMLALIRRRCHVLVAPDSGVLTMAYCLDAPFDLTVVSLWSDARLGIHRIGATSPNPRLKHLPLTGRGGNVGNVMPEDVAAVLLGALQPQGPVA